MRAFVLNHTGRFFLLWLGAVILGTGLGTLAVGNGVPVSVVMYTQLALQLALAFAVGLGVPERLGGAVAAALVLVLPVGTFVTWLEMTFSDNQSLALGVAAAGFVLAAASAWRPSPTTSAVPVRVET